MRFSITVCASGGGGNFQALIDASEHDEFVINHLIVDRECGAITRAVKAGIPVTKIEVSNGFQNALRKAIPHDSDLVVLAGFMPIIPSEICNEWEGKIINTHPSLLPKYGGKGMFGVKVQEAVMAAGEKLAGCSVHFVNSEVDGGEVLLQSSIEVDYRDTPWQLGGKIFSLENRLLVQAVNMLKERHHSKECSK